MQAVAKNYATPVNADSDDDVKRISEAKKSLTKMAKHAHGLAKTLQQTPLSKLVLAYCAMEDMVLPLPLFIDIYDRNKLGQLIEGLDNFATFAEHLLKRLPADKGGRGKLRTKFELTSKQILVISCFELFWHYRPDQEKGSEATKGENGDYAALVRTVYEIATGRDADASHPGLDAYVRKAAPRLNKLIRENPNFALLQKLVPHEPPLRLLSLPPIGLRIFGKPTHLFDDIDRRYRPHAKKRPQRPAGGR